MIKMELFGCIHIERKFDSKSEMGDPGSGIYIYIVWFFLLKV